MLFSFKAFDFVIKKNFKPSGFDVISEHKFRTLKSAISYHTNRVSNSKLRKIQLKNLHNEETGFVAPPLEVFTKCGCVWSTLTDLYVFCDNSTYARNLSLETAFEASVL